MQYLYPKYLLISSLIVLASCSTTYIPPLVNAPLLKEKDELRGGAYLTTKGLHFNLGYATGHSTAFVADGWFTILPESVFEEWLPESGGLNFGLGLYGSNGQGAHYELYGGLGWGTGTKRRGTDLFENASYFRFFVQPDLGIRQEKFELVLASRLSYLAVYQFNFEGFDYGGTNGLFIEPSAQIRIPVNVEGDRNFLTLQGDLSIPFKGESAIPFDYAPFVLGVGFNF